MVVETVELPAHNVRHSTFVDEPAQIVGGPECLATRGLASGHVYFFTEPAGGGVPNKHEIGVGAAPDGQSTALGFGVWEKPVGATVTDVRYIGEGFITGKSPASDRFFWENRTNDPIAHEPALIIDTLDDPWFFGGFNLSTFLANGTPEPVECSAQLSPVLIDQVVVGPGSPFSNGLQPDVYWPVFLGNPGTMTLTYLAIRVTYESFAVAGVPPVRQYPRDDGLGLSVAPRLHPLPKARQRLVGGYQ